MKVGGFGELFSYTDGLFWFDSWLAIANQCHKIKRFKTFIKNGYVDLSFS